MTGLFNGYDDDENQSIGLDGVGSGGGDRSHGRDGSRRSLEEGDRHRRTGGRLGAEHVPGHSAAQHRKHRL